MASIKVYMKNEDRDNEIKGVPRIKKEYSKKMISDVDETVMYFIDRDYGLKRKLTSKMNYANVHPIDKNMVEITIEINRVD